MIPKKVRSFVKCILNQDLPVSELLSKKKGYLVLLFLCFDIFPALLQLFPWMGLLPFIALYMIPYCFTLLTYSIVSLRNPGFKQKKSGHDLIEHLQREQAKVKTESMTLSKIKNFGVKYCYKCNILKGISKDFVTPGKSRHCEICQKCVEHYDHHCPYVLNCIGRKNSNIFLVFLVTTTLFLLLRFVFTLLASLHVICWTSSTSTSALFLSVYSSKGKCYYKYSLLGKLGSLIHNWYRDVYGLYVLLVILNWIYVVLNFLFLCMISVLLKHSIANFLQGTTTYERHVRANRDKDSIFRKELDFNLININ